jgi:hypothetical protein
LLPASATELPPAAPDCYPGLSRSQVSGMLDIRAGMSAPVSRPGPAGAAPAGSSGARRTARGWRRPCGGPSRSTPGSVPRRRPPGGTGRPRPAPSPGTPGDLGQQGGPVVPVADDLDELGHRGGGLPSGRLVPVDVPLGGAGQAGHDQPGRIRDVTISSHSARIEHGDDKGKLCSFPPAAAPGRPG